MTDTQATAQPARTLRFPADHPVGLVSVATPGEPPPAPLPAQGVIEAPEGATVLLAATTPGEPDADTLRGLAPDGLDALVGIVLDDDKAEALSGMTTLHTLMAPGGQVGNTGLAHLAKLTRLDSLIVTVAPDVTAEGIGHLVALPTLRMLVLAGRVAAETLAPLADAPALRNLQSPRPKRPRAKRYATCCPS